MKAEVDLVCYVVVVVEIGSKRGSSWVEVEESLMFLFFSSFKKSFEVKIENDERLHMYKKLTRTCTPRSKVPPG